MMKWFNSSSDNFYDNVFTPHGKIIALVSLVIFISLFGTCIYQESGYPHTKYEYHQTGEICCKPGTDERVCGPCVESVPIYEPDNPGWVDFMRSSWFRGGLIAIGFIVLAIVLAAFSAPSSSAKRRIRKREEAQIEATYELTMDAAGPERQKELRERYSHWQTLMQKGLSPEEADEEAKSWEKEKLEIEAIYKKELEASTLEKRSGLEIRYYRWRYLMHEGLSPKEADQEVRSRDSSVK